MSRNGLGPIGLDKLEVALDTYGADRTRWPAPLRLTLSGLIAGNPDAQKMLREAEAFDRLLDEAPQYDFGRLGGLNERIASAVERQPRVVSDRPAAAGGATARSNLRPGFLRRHHGFAATALAASLVLGLFAGQLKVFNSTADVLLGGVGSANPNASGQMAQTEDSDSFLDEDML